MHPKFTLALANEHLSSVPYTSVDVRWLRLYISSSLALARLQESGEAVETLDKAIIVAGAGRDGDELGKEVFELLREKQRGMVLPRLDVPVPASLACMKHKPELGDGGCPCASVRTDMRDDDNGDSDGDSVIDDDRTTRTEQDKLKHLSDLLVASHPIPRISPTSASSSPPNDHTTNHPAQPYITKITWPAMHRWSDPNYLLSIAGPGRYVPVEIGRAYDEPGWGQRIVPFEQFLRRAWRCPELLDTGGRTAGGEASDGRGEGPESKVVGSEDGGRGGAGEEGVGRPTKRRRLGGYPTIATDQPRRAETETETAASQVDGAFTASPANDPLSVTATATKFQCQPRVPPPVDLQGTGKKELGPPMYLAQYDLFRQFPELQRDISMPDQVWAVDSDESDDSDECDDDDDDNDEDDHLDDREDGDRCADRSVQPDQNSGNGTDQDDRDIRPAGGQRARSRSKPKIRDTKKSRPRPADGPILNIWLGSGNGELVSPAHTDPWNNCYVQVTGYKRVWLAPPETEMAVHEGYMANTSSIPIFKQSSPLEKYSEANGAGAGARESEGRDRTRCGSKARGESDSSTKADAGRKGKIEIKGSMEAVLGPGDMLVMPRGWWHAMRGEGDGAVCSVSIWY